MTGDQRHHQHEVFQQTLETLRSAIPHPTRWAAALKEAVEALETALRVADEERQHQAVVAGAQPATVAMSQQYQALEEAQARLSAIVESSQDSHSIGERHLVR